MKKLWILILLTGLALSSCISVSVATDTPAPSLFVTSTLPPTKQQLIPPTQTPTSIEEEATQAPTLAVTAPPNCTERAVLIEDVTIPDDTRVTAGESFTKTWRFKNTGTCHWSGYSIVYLTGDRMGAPDSAPIPDTLADSTVDISVDLVAPTADGSYSAYFTLKNAEGETIQVGTEKTFWVKIIVGNPSTSPPSSGSNNPSSNTAGSTTSNTANCQSSQNAGFVGQIQALVNNARADAGLPALSFNAQLTSAAQGHSDYMACNSLLSHTGLNGSSVHARVVAAGYSPSYSEEIIYGGGGPQAAFNWWMNDKIHRDAILSTRANEMGIGYTYVENSTYGSYIAVNFASP